MAIKGLRGAKLVELKKDDGSGVKYGEEIVDLTGATNVSMTPQIAEAAMHGDDQLLEMESALTAIDVGFELASLTLEQQAFLTGQKIVNGVLVENKDAVPPEVAFGFLAPLSNTGGGGNRRIWLLKGRAKPLEESAKTKEDNVEFQKPTINFTFMPRIYDGNFRLKSDSNVEGSPKDSEFFSVAFLEKDHTNPDIGG